MQRCVRLMVGCLAIAVCAGGRAQGSEAGETGAVMRATLELSDGSRLIGVPALTAVPVDASFGKMAIPVAKIMQVSLGTNRESVTIELTNGDKVTGAMGLEAVELATCFGKVSVGMGIVRRMQFWSGANAGLPAGLGEGLVLYYSFDSDEGERVSDKSGKGHHGVVTGGKWTAEGKSGGACSLNGVGDFVRAAGYKGVVGAKAVSVCAWARSVAYNPGGQYIVAWGDGGQVGGAVMVCYNGAEDRSIFAGIGGLNVIGGNSPQGDGVWHHVVAVISDAQVSLYIDGRLAKSERAANGVNVRSNEDVTIGQGWGSCFLNGAVDEVMIFEKALTSDEVKVLYSRR